MLGTTDFWCINFASDIVLDMTSKGMSYLNMIKVLIPCCQSILWATISFNFLDKERERNNTRAASHCYE